MRKARKQTIKNRLFKAYKKYAVKLHWLNVVYGAFFLYFTDVGSEVEEEEDEEDIDQREKVTGSCCSGDERGDNSFVNIGEQTDTTEWETWSGSVLCVCVCYLKCWIVHSGELCADAATAEPEKKKQLGACAGSRWSSGLLEDTDRWVKASMKTPAALILVFSWMIDGFSVSGLSELKAHEHESPGLLRPSSKSQSCNHYVCVCCLSEPTQR